MIASSSQGSESIPRSQRFQQILVRRTPQFARLDILPEERLPLKQLREVTVVGDAPRPIVRYEDVDRLPFMWSTVVVNGGVGSGHPTQALHVRLLGVIHAP